MMVTRRDDTGWIVENQRLRVDEIDLDTVEIGRQSFALCTDVQVRF